MLGDFVASKMLSLRDLWTRHRRKILITSCVLGSGYFLYKLYSAHKRRLADLERELANEREHDELIKAQMQAHFENIQRIADTTTLPHAMYYLSSRIAKQLDLSQLTDRLLKGKGQPNTLTSLEKLELWDRLKILSFTRFVVSLWATTILSLYIRTQEDVDLIERDDQQSFLASSDFLANYGILGLISNVQEAVMEVLKGKQLRDLFNNTILHETFMQILDLFMSRGGSHHWADYMMPEDARFYKLATASSSDETIVKNTAKFEQLMAEVREVLSSAEFGRVAEISLKAVVDAVVDVLGSESTGASLTSGMPLARLLPRVAQMCPVLLDEPDQNRFIQIIRGIPEVELFFTLLYANMPTL